MSLVALVALPLLGGITVLWGKNKRVNIPFLTAAVLLVLEFSLFKNTWQGSPLNYKIPLPGPFQPVLQADPLTTIFVVLATFLWAVVSIYAPDYMKLEGRGENFEVVTLLTLASVLGVFLAGDLITMLLFFELMTIASFFWVVHRWNGEAIRAGYFYLFFSIIGGLFIALGIVLLGSAPTQLPLVGAGPTAAFNSPMFACSFALFLVGFGIKAGLAPLHLWLPYAHSAAPTPGSALLSGLLIKIGAYGLIRLGEMAGWGLHLGPAVAWLGPFLTVAGIATMLTGVVAALLQSDAKRLLAYHSVSQMGYIILGLGLGLYLGPKGDLGLVGALYHIVNHALFKAALFLGVGVIYMQTKKTDLYSLGGLWRRFPLTAVFMFLAVLGIAGAPGLNGYASKTLLHHAVDLAAARGPAWLCWAERLFSLVGVGTAASFSKLYYLLFFGKAKRATKTPVVKTTGPLLALGLLSAVMLAIGLQPGLFPAFAAKAARTLGMANAPQALLGLSFWQATDIVSTLITLGLGVLVCWAGLKSGAFHWHAPLWLSLESLGKLAYGKIVFLWWAGLDFNLRLQAKLHQQIKAQKETWLQAYKNATQPRGGKIAGFVWAGVSANAALLIMALVLLIAWYTITHPLLPGMPSVAALFH